MSIEYEHHMPRFRLIRISLLAIIIGILTGIAAELLDQLIGLVTNIAFYQRLSTELISPLGSQSPLLLIFVPALGGMITGAMAKYGTPLVRGHGIPEAMEAVLEKQSRISPRVAPLKPLSAAISIGSGQPFGPEGPIIQTGGAIGSLLGQMFRTTAAERKVLLACGAAAGLTAIFGTLIAAKIFAVEILLFEFRARSFIPQAIANVVAAEMHIALVSGQPVFAVGAIDFGTPPELVLFLGFGIIAGLASTAVTRSLYWIEDQFHRSRINTYQSISGVRRCTPCTIAPANCGRRWSRWRHSSRNRDRCPASTVIIALSRHEPCPELSDSTCAAAKGNLLSVSCR